MRFQKILFTILMLASNGDNFNARNVRRTGEQLAKQQAYIFKKRTYSGHACMYISMYVSLLQILVIGNRT